ncbi:MAG: 5'/3'-nucleotidase SurE [Bacteroidetes bacterium]|nr:5'/3'-nucleotidase SurE [Bacteroidota bacterium]
MAKIKAEKPVILITNDDSISAPGIKALVEAVKDLGKVIVVAPDKPQSGMGHAITLGQHLRLQKAHIVDGVEAFTCSGTPVDCVKLAVDKVLHRKPSICLSGINHGANHSINVIYSGTMSAAVEASIDGMKAIGFSLCDYSWNANFEVVKPYIKQLMSSVLANDLPYGTLLNVNLPVPEDGQIKGIKICRQAQAKWKESFDQRKDPFGRDYYWMTGNFVNMDHGQDTDEWALKHDYVSVVPTMFDLTDHQRIAQLNQWGLDEFSV